MEAINFRSEGQLLSGFLRPAEDTANKAVIFCHGAFESQDNWSDFAERLCQEGITTYTFDFVGHGESEGLRSRVDLRLWAHNIRDALNALTTLGYKEFALVGWGLGGSAALLAAAHDQRLRTVVTLATPVSLVPGLGERVAYGVISLVAKLKRSLLKRPLTLSRLNELEDIQITYDEEANQAYFSNPNLRQAYQAVPIPESLDSVWFDIRDTIRKVTIPVLVIHGAQDALIPVEQSEKIITALGGTTKLEILDECGHGLHLDAKRDVVFESVSKWIKKRLDPAGKRS